MHQSILSICVYYDLYDWDGIIFVIKAKLIIKRDFLYNFRSNRYDTLQRQHEGRIQCDQMVWLLVQYLAIYNNERLPFNNTLCQILNKPSKISKQSQNWLYIAQ